jgi:CubicO group peptidase (beta-lactamase class C family)
MRPMARVVCGLVAVVAAVGLLAGCAAGDGDARGDGSPAAASVTPAGAWPVPDWKVTTPADAGLDPVALEAMATAAASAGSSCLVVTRHGELAGEWYWNGHGADDQLEAFSATKSITSTLVGIAASRGLIDIDAPASTWITEWQGTPSSTVTVRNLLANDSGRQHDLVTDYVQMAISESDKTGFAIGLDQQWEPGSRWDYNNAAIQVLDAVITRSTGMPTAEFARTALFEPLGMATTLTNDPAGNTLTYAGARASCRDLARFGLLFLRQGDWDGQQIVPSDWVAEATSPSQGLNTSYGLLWWLPGLGAVGATGASEPDLATGVPDGAYAAIGAFDQLVVVDPARGIVVTRMGTPQEQVEGVTFNASNIADWLVTVR